MVSATWLTASTIAVTVPTVAPKTIWMARIFAPMPPDAEDGTITITPGSRCSTTKLATHEQGNIHAKICQNDYSIDGKVSLGGQPHLRAGQHCCCRVSHRKPPYASEPQQ